MEFLRFHGHPILDPRRILVTREEKQSRTDAKRARALEKASRKVSRPPPRSPASYFHETQLLIKHSVRWIHWFVIVCAIRLAPRIAREN